MIAVFRHLSCFFLVFSVNSVAMNKTLYASELPAPALHMVVGVEDRLVSVDVVPDVNDDWKGMPDLRIKLKCIVGCNKNSPYEELIGPAQPIAMGRLWGNRTKTMFYIVLSRVSSSEILVYSMEGDDFKINFDKMSKTFPIFTNDFDGRLQILLSSTEYKTDSYTVFRSSFVWDGEEFSLTGSQNQ